MSDSPAASDSKFRASPAPLADREDSPEVSHGGTPRSDEAQPEQTSGNGDCSQNVETGSADAADTIVVPSSPGLDDQLLGEFRLLRRLGRGGMAEVYLAEQTSLKRQVAVKVLRDDTVTDENHLRRFKQEAKAAAVLNHPNIVQVYVIGEQEGTHFIAQEYVQGWNLREYLSRQGLPTAAEALQIMIQVAAALQAAAEAGIVHRDIKPENIMITRKGEVKVADFGLARLTRGDDRVNLTQVGVTMGTPLYMSPEQVNGGDVDQRSDLYSFGVTCYHLLAGKPPFDGQTALSVAVQHLNNEPAVLSQRRPDLPRSLCAIVHQLMAKDRNKRYPDAQSVLTDLRQVARSLDQDPHAQVSLPFLAHAATPSPPLHRRILRRLSAWKGSRQTGAFLLACLIVIPTSAGIGWWMRPPDPLAAPPRDGRVIPRKESAAAQYFQAMLLVDDEDAWKAVIEYFEDSTLERNAAKQHLALLYLRERRFADAQAIFEEFERIGDQDLTLKANGLAGKAVLASLRGRHNESQELIIVELENDDLRKHLGEEMDLYVTKAKESNSRALGEQVKQGREQLFDNGD
jgi:eukaryotic-like serine/threonine-protein kinase